MNEIVQAIDKTEYHIIIEDQKNGWAKIVTNCYIDKGAGVKTRTKYVLWVELINYMIATK